MSAKSASLEPQPCRQRNSGRRGAALPPPREYCTCVTCSGSPNRPGTTCDSRPIRPVGVFGSLESWESLVSCSRISLMPPIYPFQRGNPHSHWKDWDAERLVSGMIVLVGGGFGTLGGLLAGRFSPLTGGIHPLKAKRNPGGEKTTGERKEREEERGQLSGTAVGSWSALLLTSPI